MARATIVFLAPNNALIGTVNEFAVTGTATVAANRPTVPAGATVALVTALDGAIYAATGSDPTVNATDGFRVGVGRPLMMPVASGNRLSFMNAPSSTTAPLGAGEAHIGEVSGNWLEADGTMVRPAGSANYTSGALIANNASAGSVTPITIPIARIADRSVSCKRLRLKINDSAFKGAVVRCHLFQVLPVVSVGDNGALNTSETYNFNDTGYLGYQDITLTQQFASNVVKGFVACDFIASPATGTVNLFALLESRSAVAAGGTKQFVLTLEAQRT